jgi:type IV pilus assembly protein PilY1
VIFTTLVPDTDPCSDGGTSFLMTLQAITGARLGSTPFDVNRDGVFDGGDSVGGLPISGLDPNVGITPEPGILQSSSGDKEFQYNAGTTGLIGITIGNPGQRSSGRQSWRQIR